MTPQKRKFRRRERAHMAREERDYFRFSRFAGSAGEDLTSREQEWVLGKSIRYLALLLALDDCYENFTALGVRQGNHSIDWWERWLRTLTENELDAELLRLLVKCNTQICSWIDQQRGGA